MVKFLLLFLGFAMNDGPKPKREKIEISFEELTDEQVEFWDYVRAQTQLIETRNNYTLLFQSMLMIGFSNLFSSNQQFWTVIPIPIFGFITCVVWFVVGCKSSAQNLKAFERLKGTYIDQLSYSSVFSFFKINWLPVIYPVLGMLLWAAMFFACNQNLPFS